MGVYCDLKCMYRDYEMHKLKCEDGHFPMNHRTGFTIGGNVGQY
jgi:hypothetical protein